MGPYEQKRKVNLPNTWKGNSRKTIRIERKSYESVTGKLVLSWSTGPDCHCKFKCFEEMPAELKKFLLEIFNEIEIKLAHDCYLAGLVTVQ